MSYPESHFSDGEPRGRQCGGGRDARRRTKSVGGGAYIESIINHHDI